MAKIIASTNKEKNGFHFQSDYHRNILMEWMKQYDQFEIIPVAIESKKMRRYLEGAVVPAYCKWQYSIDERDPNMDEARRFLFKRDFNYEIIDDRDGTPTRIPSSTKGKAKQMLEKYTAWAEENGAPIPNPDLYKIWRDRYSADPRFPTFHDFLSFLGLECDAMPSDQTLKALDEVDGTIEYPKEDTNPNKIPF